jgi:hypothetical protein
MMGHHINDKGQFVSDKYPSDKYPDLHIPPDHILLSFKDPEGRRALRFFAGVTLDMELGKDIRKRTWSMEKEEAALAEGT